MAAAQDRRAPLGIRSRDRHRVERIEPLAKGLLTGHSLDEAASDELQRPSRLRGAAAGGEPRRLAQGVESLVDVGRMRAAQLEHLEQGAGRAVAAVDRLEDAARGEPMVPEARQLLERRARRPLLRVERERLLEGVERAGHVPEPQQTHRAQTREDLGLLAALGERGVARERLGQLGPHSRCFEEGDGDRERVARDAEALHHGAARRDRAWAVLRLLRADLGGANQELARRRWIRRVGGALVEETRKLHGIAAGLVEGREGLEGARAGAGREEALVGRDRPRRLLQPRAELRQLLVDPGAPLGIRLDVRDALEHVAEAPRVLLLLVNLAEGVRGHEDRVGRRLRRREDTREGRLRPLRVAAAEEHLTELRARLGLDGWILHGPDDATERLRRVGEPLQLRRERDVAGAQIVVRGVDRERLLEGIECTCVIAQSLAPQRAEAQEEARPLGAARVVELERQVARDLLRRSEGLERRGESGRGAPREPLDDDELLRDLSRRLVGRVDGQQLLDVRERPFGLLKLVRVELHDAREERLARAVPGRRLGDQRLLVEANDVAEPVRPHVEGLESSACVLVTGLEAQDPLQELHHLVVRASRLDQELRGSAQEGHLLAPCSMLRRGRVDLGQLLRLPALGEQRVDLRERAAMVGPQGERALQVRDSAGLVAEDVAEEAARLEEELRGDGRLRRPQALALRDALERKRDFAQSLVAMGRHVESLPRVCGKSCARERGEHRIDEGLFVLDLRLEREGGSMGAGPSPRRLLLHGKPWDVPSGGDTTARFNETNSDASRLAKTSCIGGARSARVRALSRPRHRSCEVAH